MRRRRLTAFGTTFSLVFFVLVPMLYAQSDSSQGINVVKYDTNGDGKIDLVMRFDNDGTKVSEAIDFNHDGRMDDFYFYKRGVLVSRQIDTNFDGRIDLWVWLSEGVYVTRYERDTDYDGKPDIIKSFGARDASAATAPQADQGNTK